MQRKTISARIDEKLYNAVTDYVCTSSSSMNDFLIEAIENQLEPKPCNGIQLTAQVNKELAKICRERNCTFEDVMRVAIGYAAGNPHILNHHFPKPEPPPPPPFKELPERYFTEAYPDELTIAVGSLLKRGGYRY